MSLAAGQHVCVILPTYNERENLAPLVTAIRQVLPEAEVLIVDDASPDGTGEIAAEISAADGRVTVLHRSAKDGLGNAYRAAFQIALDRPSIRVVAQMDADFSHDPADLPRLLAPLERDADLVIGARYIAGGGTVGWPLYRKLLSRSGTLFARTILLLPYKDLTGGFKAWRRELLETPSLQDATANGYGHMVEMTWLAHRQGARIRQVPILFRERERGRSKMSVTIMAEAVLLILRLRWRTLRGSEVRRQTGE